MTDNTVLCENLVIPPEWDGLAKPGLRGTLLVIGATDVGKSTFASYLYRRLSSQSRQVAYLDGDPGQSTLGPPSTMTLAIGVPGDDGFPPRSRVMRSFVGAVSPRSHMLPLLVGASRLVRAAYDAGTDVLVYDTTGLVEASQGGVVLKLAKVDLLRPTTVFAIQRGRELEPLLAPLRRSRRVRVVDLRPSPGVRPRDTPARQAHRARQFETYFGSGQSQRLRADWTQLAVFPAPEFGPGRLVAFEDAGGFALALGIVLAGDVAAGQVVLQTPLASLDGTDALRLGDIIVDTETFRDTRYPL